MQDKSSSTPPVNVHQTTAAGDANTASVLNEPQSETKSGDVPSEKKSKKEKEKEKGTKMIYSDNETSPEEKMAKLSRYAFVPDGKGETVLEDAASAAVAGVVRDEEAAVAP